MGRGSFWAAGFQDDLNKDKYQSLPPYVWIWIDKIWKKMAKVKGSFWAAGFQDDLNKDVSITTAFCLNLDWQNMKKWQMVKDLSELLVSKMISIKMYQSLPPYVWILDSQNMKNNGKG